MFHVSGKLNFNHTYGIKLHPVLMKHVSCVRSLKIDFDAKTKLYGRLILLSKSSPHICFHMNPNCFQLLMHTQFSLCHYVFKLITI